MKTFPLLARLSLVAAALLVTPVHAATIDTTAGATGSVAPFGSSNTATYGETFTVGTDRVLQGFAMFLSGRAGGSGTLDLRGYIAGWDGLKATSILYTSATQTMNAAGARQEFDFDTGNLALVSGQRYVAFLSVSELPAQSNSLFTMPMGSSALYAGGDFVFYNNGTSFGALTSSTWDCHDGCGFGDVALKANLAAVPEPGSVALVGVGLAGLVAARRRRAALK